MLYSSKQVRRVAVMFIAMFTVGLVGACESATGPQYPEIEFRDGSIVEDDLMRGANDKAEPIRKRPDTQRR